MDALSRFGDRFKLTGRVTLTACPLCGSEEIGLLWQLPQNRLPPGVRLSAPGHSINTLYIDYLPTLEAPQSIFRFDICAVCETIFLNPKSDDQAIYVADKSKVKSFREKGVDEFRGFVRGTLALMPAETRKVVDMACGAGQALHLLREARPEIAYVGLELSKPSVDFMRDELKFEAHQVDLDRDDLDAIVAPGSVDFVIVQEAYEHVRDPITLMKKAARMLRPGGLVWMTAQYWGDNALQIRVGEPIYINEKGFRLTLEECGLHVEKLTRDVKIRALLRKPLRADEPVPAFDWKAAKVTPKPVAPGLPAKPGWKRRIGRFLKTLR